MNTPASPGIPRPPVRSGGARLALFVAAVALTTAGAGLFAPPSGGQVPPESGEAAPVLTVLSPIVHPACGDALLVLGVTPALGLPEEVLELTGGATSTLLVVCGSVPSAPGGTQRRCTLDHEAANILKENIPLPIPLSPEPLGWVAGEVAVIDGGFGLPIPPLGLSGLVDTVIQCQSTAVAPPPPPTTAPDTPETTTPVEGSTGPDLTAPPAPTTPASPSSSQLSVPSPSVPSSTGTVGATPQPTSQVAAPIEPSIVPIASRSQARWWLWTVWASAFVVSLAVRTPRGAHALLQLRRGPLGRASHAVRAVTEALPGPASRGLAAGALALIGYVTLHVSLPQGLPLGIVLLGLILGALTGLTALGLVLVFRVLRAINMAQAVMGTVASSLSVLLMTSYGWSYATAVPVGLGLAGVTGLGIEAIMHRFRNAPRLIVTVATIGIAQILAAVNLALPQFVSDTGDSSLFRAPLSTTFTLNPVTFTGDAIVVLAMVPAALIGLTVLLTRTNTGRAVRAVADSTERAELVGIPIRRIMRITWVVAASLSGLGAILTTPLMGGTLGVATGPELLLAPLAAAVIGRMENLTRTMTAGLAIGVAQQAFFWSYPRSSTIDVLLFLVILAGLVPFARTLTSRTSDTGLGQYKAVNEPRPVAPEVSALPGVLTTRVAAAVGVFVFALGAPILFTEATLILLTYIAIFGIVAVSLVVLTGWAGQVTFGQFALAGVGASCTAFALSRYNLDLFAALALGAIAAALAAVAIAIPTLRLPGQFAAVATLAFAVPVSTFLLNPTRFPDLNPLVISRPELFGRYSLESERAFYYLALTALAVCYLAARNIRRSRLGRTLIAVRDNERAASAWSIAPTRARLTAFAISGAMAGLAGGLYVVGLRGVPYQGFSPVTSLEVFTMVVVGGLGSLPGALLGAVYVGVVRSELGGAAQLLATGGGLLVLLLVIPEGIGGLMYRLRDRWFGRLARRRGIDPVPAAEGSDAALTAVATTSHQNGLLTWSDLSAGYGRQQVLFGVSGGVEDSEALALLGTNGAGKSTLLRVLAGVLPAQEGTVTFDGADITRLSPQNRLRRGIVTVPGGRGVFPSLSVEENLSLFAWTVKDPADVDAGIEDVYRTFPGLHERRYERASLLSGGEQQMLAVSQALICRPRLLLVDELTLGLAPATVETLLGVVSDLRARGITTILVEQSLNTAATVATRCNFMERGRNRYDGSLAELMARDDLARAVFISDDAAPTTRDTFAPAEEGSGPVLSTTGISKYYGGITAVDDVSLVVERGEIVALIGPNGAGKTTVLDMCSGFVQPDRGSIQFAGIDVSHAPADVRAELGMGRIFQDARLLPSLTVREVIATALERHIEVRDPLACLLRVAGCADSERAVTKRVDELLEAFGLRGYGNAFISELSTGSRRVVEIACAVAHQPSLLLLDEPTAGVAQRETESLAQRLLTVRETLGVTMLVVEHDLAFVRTLADRVVCLDLGSELASGSPDDVLHDPRVLHAYFGIDPGEPTARPAIDPSPATPVTISTDAHTDPTEKLP